MIKMYLFVRFMCVEDPNDEPWYRLNDVLATYTHNQLQQDVFPIPSNHHRADDVLKIMFDSIEYTKIRLRYTPINENGFQLNWNESSNDWTYRCRNIIFIWYRSVCTKNFFIMIWPIFKVGIEIQKDCFTFGRA